MFIEVCECDHSGIINRIRQLLRQLFASESILQLVSASAVAPLERYSEGYLDPTLAPNIPAFGMIIQNFKEVNANVKETVETRLKPLALQLAARSKEVAGNLISHRTVVLEANAPQIWDPHEWELTGCFYGRGLRRVRPFYEGLDSPEGEIGDLNRHTTHLCQKYFETYKKDRLTGGLMALWCPHLICLGFHKMPKAEGRDDVFSALLCYFEKAPEVVIYDFACQLAPYCRSREPEFFKDTLFVIDEMHSSGHSSCAQSSFLANYMQTNAALLGVNSSAGECGNSGLNRIRKSVSYMNEANAILYTHTYLSAWNRSIERDFLKAADEQAKRLQSMDVVNHYEEF
jgi:Kyakuja-Dileera-Zisupton transposase